MTRRTQLLDREEPVPFVEINPANAEKLGIKHEDIVSVFTRRGRVKVKARITDVVPENVIFMSFHFKEAHANMIQNYLKDLMDVLWTMI